MMNKVFLICIVAIITLPSSVSGHEVRPAFLNIIQIDSATYEIKWKIPAIGTSVPKIYLVLPDSWSELERSGNLIGNSFTQVSVIQADKTIEGEIIRFDGLENTIMDVLVSIKLIERAEFTSLIKPDSPYYIIPEAPSLFQIIKSYLVLGIEHILLGLDHLLFVFALLMITSGRSVIVKTITAFTIAHSITLSLASLGFVHVAPTPVEIVIALSIFFLAVEIINFQRGVASITIRHPWIVAFFFGLLHGFGFAGALTEVGLPQQDIPFALLFFNLGVEIGQIAFVIAILALSIILSKARLRYPGWVKAVPAYTVGIVATYWFIERMVNYWVVY